MLVVNYVIRASKIHGLGLFLTERVKKDSVIWKYDSIVDRKLSFSTLLTLPESAARNICRHAEFFPDSQSFCLGADGDAFMNHSGTPSLADGGDQMLASRDLDIGDELTCDYAKVRVLTFDPSKDNQIVAALDCIDGPIDFEMRRKIQRILTTDNLGERSSGVRLGGNILKFLGQLRSVEITS